MSAVSAWKPIPKGPVIPTIDMALLPDDAQEMIAKAVAGQPLKSRALRDDEEFENRENLLPKKDAWYFEYRVKPSVGQATHPEACRIVVDVAGKRIYFTGLHYGDIPGRSDAAFPFEHAAFYLVTGTNWV